MKMPQEEHGDGQPRAGLCEARIRSGLEALGRRIPLRFFERTDSTNLRAEEMAASGMLSEGPFAVVAASQSAGRGRFGRVWRDSPGRSVCLTVAFPAEGARGLGRFGVLAGVRICSALSACSGARIMLKWPNDLYFGGRKMGGMIACAHSSGGSMSSVFLGLGFNFSRMPHAPGEPEPACLEEAAALPVEINSACSVAIDAVCGAFEALGGDVDLGEEFRPFDFLRGKRIGVDDFSKVAFGVADGVDCDGALRLAGPDGEVSLWRAGEATIAKGGM